MPQAIVPANKHGWYSYCYIASSYLNTYKVSKSNWKRSSMDWNANLNLIFRYKLDDPLDAVAVHGGGGNNYLQPMQQTLLADYKLTIIV